MKQVLLKTWLILVCLLALGGGRVWAETYTGTVASSSGNVGSSFTLNNVSWNVTTTNGSGSPTTTYGNAYSQKCIKFGSGASNCYGSVSLSTDYFKNNSKKVTKVEINALGSAKKNVTFSIGTSTMTQEVAANTWTKLALDNLNITGTLQLSFNLNSAGFFINQIVVTYKENGGSTATPLSVPTNLSSSNVTSTGATLSWDAVANASSYKVKIGSTEYDANTNSYSATGLTASTQYTWSVKAIGDGTNYSSSDYAANANFTTEAPASHKTYFYVNGTLQNAGGTDFTEGASITFPADPELAEVVFMGWTKTEDYAHATDAPSDLCKAATMGDADVTYYAVFASAAVGNTYTQITAANALEVGARYLIVGNSSSTYKALPVDKAETLTTVTPSSSKITNPAEELIWTLEGTAKNWKIKSVSNGKYLQISGGNLTFESSTSLTFDASVSSNKFTFTSSATSGNKILSYYASGSKFNAYTSANNVYLYKASVDYSDYCTTVKAVTGVAVKTAPTTVAYCEGEKFNPAGLEVTLTYEDATIKDVAYTDATASKFTFSPALDAALATTNDNVQITINGQSCNQTISVRSVSISAPIVAEGTYTVKVGDAEAVTADGNTINALKGQKVVLASTPATGYKLASTPFVVKDEDDTNVSVSTAGGQYSFTMPAKNVTITAQFTRVYTITAGSCEHGSITAIKDKDDAEITETSYRSKVVVEATADTHYHLNGMYYVKEGDDAHNEISENEGVYSFTMPQSNVTVYATFADDTQYSISWMVNGTEAKSEQVYADVPVSAPTVEAINGKVFRGWVAEEIDGTTDETPSFVNVTSLTVSEDKVFYAVFATETGTPETHNIITYQTENFPSSYAAAADYTLNDVSFNITQAYVNGQKTQWRKSGDSNGTGTMYNNDAMDISKITLTYDNSDNYKNFTIKVGNSANPTSGTEITGVEDSNNNKVYVFDCSSENASYFVLTNGTNAGYLASIDITCGGATYSGYTTSPSPVIVLDENSASTEEIVEEAVRVTVARSMKANIWNTLCLPFDMDEAQIAANFGVDAEVKKFSGLTINGDNYSLQFSDASTIDAGTAYMVRVKNPVTEINVSGVDVVMDDNTYKCDGQEEFDDYENVVSITFQGNYYTKVVPMDSYIISSNKFYLVDSTVTNKGFRGYFVVEVDGASSNKARNLSFSFDDVATGIEGVTVEGLDNKVFDLQGRRVMNAKNGMYIINGKKVIR